MKYTTPGGEVYSLFADALKQPHLLIAGATGSGKSVVINGLIYTALHSLPGSQAGGKQLVLIDPKRVELSQWQRVPHTIAYSSEPADMVHALRYAMTITENRFQLMQSKGKRKFPGGDVYIIIDEFSDLILTQKRTVKPLIQRLAQIGRAANVHIVLATQTPISQVLPTEIKCNFDSRFALRTRSAQDSRNITGFKGCELLPRYGQAYYITPSETKLYNVPMIEDSQLEQMARYWEKQRPYWFIPRTEL